MSVSDSRVALCRMPSDDHRSAGIIDVVILDVHPYAHAPHTSRNVDNISPSWVTLEDAYDRTKTPYKPAHPVKLRGATSTLPCRVSYRQVRVGAPLGSEMQHSYVVLMEDAVGFLVSLVSAIAGVDLNCALPLASQLLGTPVEHRKGDEEGSGDGGYLLLLT